MKIRIIAATAAAMISLALGAQTPDGFQNWHCTALVFQDSVCVRIENYDNQAKMTAKLKLRKGQQLTVIATDNKNNINLTPAAAGSRADSYIVSTNIATPEIWYATATAAKSGKPEINFTPLTSKIKLEFEYIPEGLDSLTFDLTPSYDRWSPFDHSKGLSESTRRHFNLTSEQMREGLFLTVMPMVNCAETDSSKLRTQIPVTFHYEDKYKPGVIPFKTRLNEGKIFNAKFTDSHETFFDNEYNFEYNVCDIITGETKSKKMPLSLWNIKRNYEVAKDTTDFKMNVGANFAFWFGSQGVNAGWYDGKTEFGKYRGYDINKAKQWADYGFDFFRIPIDEGWCFFSDGTLKPDCQDKLKAFVDASIEQGVRVILDLHWLAKTQILPDPEQEIRFRKCWEILHDVFGEYDPEYLAYELLNEATGLDGFWNTFLEYNIGMIRSWGGKEVRRPIVCANEEYMSIDDFDKLQLPQDPNLIASFHDYSPVLFCFYMTGFVGGMDYDQYTGPIHYPGLLVTYEELEYMKENEPKNYEIALHMKGESWERESLYEHMKKALPTKQRLNVPVLVGEYGAFPGEPGCGAAYEDRLQYFKDVTWAFRKLGFAFSYWFDLTKKGILQEQPDKQLIEAVVKAED